MPANQSENCPLPARRPAQILASVLHAARRTDGSPIIEFALVFPLMMIMVVGMFGLGLILNNYILLTNLTSTAARNLALTDNLPSVTDPCQYAVTRAIQGNPGLNTSNITWGVVWITYNASGTASSPVNYPASAGAPGAIPTCDGRAILANDNVTVTASIPATFYTYGLAPTSMNVTARSSELMQ